MTYLGWRAWFGDGKVYDSKWHSWNYDLPDEGCQIVMIYYAEEYAPGKHYRSVQDNQYYYETGGKAIKGTLIPSADYQRIFVAAFASVEW